MGQKKTYYKASFFTAFMVWISSWISSCANMQDGHNSASVQRAFDEVQCNNVYYYSHSDDDDIAKAFDYFVSNHLQYNMTAAYCVSAEQSDDTLYRNLIANWQLNDTTINQWVKQSQQLESEGAFSLAAVYYTGAYKVMNYHHGAAYEPARDLLNLAILSSQNGQQFNAAIWLLNERRVLIETQENSLNLLKEHTLDHAATYRLKGDYASARQLYTQVISYLYELGATDNRLADMYMLRVQLAIVQGLSREAQNDLFIAYRLYCHDFANLGLVTYWLGDIQQQAGNIADSEIYYQQSVDYRNKMHVSNPSPGRAIVLAESQVALADLQAMRGQIESAGELYQASIELLMPWLGVDSALVNDIKRKLENLKGNASEA